MLTRKDQDLLGLCIRPPLHRRERWLAPGIALRTSEIRTRPSLQRVCGDHIPVLVRVHRGPVCAEADPRREPEHSGEVGGERDGLDLGMWMGEVQQQCESEVPSCGVAADDHVGWRAVRLRDDVAEGFGSLAQLGRVGGVWSKGVCQEEDGDVMAVCVEVGYDVRVEVEVAGCAADGESAT